MSRAHLLGIFTGGHARRLGGIPKGLLPASEGGPPIVARLIALAGEAGLTPVLVGDAAPYVDAMPDLVVLPDRPVGIGPLGGLAALLEHAGDHAVVTVACDMPFVTAELLERVARGREAAGDGSGVAPIVAARRTDDGPFEPFLARYDAPRVTPILTNLLGEGVRSFQELFARVRVDEWRPSDEERAAWRDWDTPEDLPSWAAP